MFWYSFGDPFQVGGISWGRFTEGLEPLHRRATLWKAGFDVRVARVCPHLLPRRHTGLNEQSRTFHRAAIKIKAVSEHLLHLYPFLPLLSFISVFLRKSIKTTAKDMTFVWGSKSVLGPKPRGQWIISAISCLLMSKCCARFRWNIVILSHVSQLLFIFHDQCSLSKTRWWLWCSVSITWTGRLSRTRKQEMGTWTGHSWDERLQDTKNTKLGN